MTPLEAIAVVCGLACVWLTVRQNIWCWPLGLAQVSIYIVIFYQAKLYSDTLLHIVYVGLQVYGWRHWLKGGLGGGPLRVSSLSGAAVCGWAGATLLVTAGWGWAMATWTDASLPYWDAYTTVASLAAQWLMIRKRVESWWFWISVDVVAIGVYAYKALYLTSGLYAVFLVMATLGLLAWGASARQQDNEDRTDTRQVCPAP
ncbi:Nicotinamide riboside transporter PnuC [Posidoniimonas corsicana]|uniref:Nicotinamide riboside transporter PnuC n=1 Tax=Posidoniimonas corsicana TaxID=1938618 RepID=A0A5C5VJ18_9BACT|nr:nicotinamide riboside transporter PnuC [Posidoniimonas corsicana]TWT37983.1 Nicotinamide riboside transporter PnuC [Posidoniimonas corsicana]